MVDSFLLLETGDFLLQEDGSSKLILEVEAVGGPSGGRSKAVGAKSLAEQQLEKELSLGERPHKRLEAKSKAQLQIKPVNESTVKLQIRLNAESHARLQPVVVSGVSIAQLQTKSISNSFARVRTASRGESTAYLFDSKYIINKINKLEKFHKLMNLSMLYHSMESIDDIYHDSKEEEEEKQ